MRCVTCNEAHFLLPAALETEDGTLLPMCEGCRESVLQLSGPRVKREVKAKSLSELSLEELHDMLEEAEGTENFRG